MCIHGMYVCMHPNVCMHGMYGTNIINKSHRVSFIYVTCICAIYHYLCVKKTFSLHMLCARYMTCEKQAYMFGKIDIRLLCPYVMLISFLGIPNSNMCILSIEMLCNSHICLFVINI